MVNTWLRNVVAEAVGTFALVFFTVLVVAVGAGATPEALTYGFVVAGLVAALGHVSGGHFNPAVTLGLLLCRKINIRGAALYWVAQLVGGVLGALTVMLSMDRDAVAIGTPEINDAMISVGGAIAVEAVVTFVLLLVVFGTVVDERSPISVYPFAIGLTIAAGSSATRVLSGGALNPARGFGPAVVGGEWGGVAAWSAGPIIGAVLAWALYWYVISPRERPEREHRVRPPKAPRPGKVRPEKPARPERPLRRSRKQTFPEPVPPPPGPPLTGD